MVGCDARPTTTGATSPVPELSGRGSDFIVSSVDFPEVR